MIARAALAALAVLLATAPAVAQKKTPVDLELSFVVDASGSIDQEEIQLQRQGYANALANPQVQRAIASGFLRSIAITYIEFAADECVWQWVNWTKISDLASARAAGAKIMAAPREFCSGGNAIGDAVAFATKSTLENGFDGTRKVIDVSGDGPDTTGYITVEEARAVALANGFTINGLVIHRPSMPELGDYYRASITGGAPVLRDPGQKPPQLRRRHRQETDPGDLRRRARPPAGSELGDHRPGHACFNR